MKQNTIKIFSSAIFLIVGIIFCVFSINFLVDSWKFVKNSVVTEGLVIDLVERQGSPGSDGVRYTYAPRMSFTASDGKEYTFISKLSSNPPSYSAGDGVRISYNPKDPSDARINSFFGLWGFFLIFFGAGFLCFLIGLILFVKTIQKSRLREWLKINGQTIEATVQKVKIDGSGGREKVVWCAIIAQWTNPSSGRVYTFKSDSIGINPASLGIDIFNPIEMIGKIREIVNPEYLLRYFQENLGLGDKIKVIIDPNDPKKYFIDINRSLNYGNNIHSR